MAVAMDGFVFGIGIDRWAFCAATAALWLVACWFWLRPARIAGSETASTVIVHASQTGTAEAFAYLTHQGLQTRGEDCSMLPLHLLAANQLLIAQKLLIFASTTGVGEAPDGTREVEQNLLSQSLKLPHLEVFVLALGDRTYEHFCAFGERLGEWAAGTGAKVHVITVDNQSSTDLAQWDNLMLANGLPALDEAVSEEFQDWRIVRCEEIAPGDAGPIEVSRSGPLFRVDLKPETAGIPSFKVGDLFDWQDTNGARREFSIASLPTDEVLQLIVRRVELRDGALGRASSALTGAEPFQPLRAKLRSFPNFHETEGNGPLLAIASGSGWGGIRSHVLAAMEKNRPVWLIYGERGPGTESTVFAEMRTWQESGELENLSLGLSRAPTCKTHYVQDCIAQDSEALASFLSGTGAIVVCGSVAMADAVSNSLERALGNQWLDNARNSNRLRIAAY
ncbi:MAG: NADPH cytochrome P450 oxidoreductase family protein [Pseudomonadota bacterium]